MIDLKIEPSSGCLVFTGPFTDLITVQMTLENPSEEKLTYKIKTTVPDLYCVKPKTGFIEAKEKVTVDVILISNQDKFQPEEYNRHRFLVQWMKIPYPESLGDYRNSTATEANHFWTNADTTLIRGKRLSCVYEMPHNEEPSVLSIEDSAYVSSNDDDVQIKEVSDPSIGWNFFANGKWLFFLLPLIVLVIAGLFMPNIITEDQLRKLVEENILPLLESNSTYLDWFQTE